MEARVKLHLPTEESFLIPLKYIDVTRTTGTTLDVMSEKHIEHYWNFDGERTVGCTDRFHKIHRGWTNVVRGETDEKTNDLQAGQVMARNVETHV